MSIITAYKCDKTGKIFESKENYVKHIRKIAAKKRQEKKIELARIVETKWWEDNFWNRVKSLEQLKAAILYHRDMFAANGVKQYWHRSKLLSTPIIDFCRFDLKWDKCVSNSHHCPRNGVTNWGRELGKPFGYPGWVGNISYVVQSHKKQMKSYPGSSDMWKNTRIITGTGGGGGGNQEKFLQEFLYSVFLFEDDWPAMARSYQEVRTFCTLSGINKNLDSYVNELHPAEYYFKDVP